MNIKHKKLCKGDHSLAAGLGISENGEAVNLSQFWTDFDFSFNGCLIVAF